MRENFKEIIVDNDGRIDKLLSIALCLSRNKVQDLLFKNLVFVNGVIINKANHRVEIGDIIKINFNEINNLKYLDNTTIPYEYDLDVVYEDEYMIIVNKPSGMLTHPTNFNEQNTLINACLHYFKQKNIENDP